jgi:hypothetical protein
VSLERFFPRSSDAKRNHFSGPLHEAFARGDNSDANAVHFGRRIDTHHNQIHHDMSARDIVTMLSR